MYWDQRVAQRCIGMYHMDECMEIALTAGEMQKYVEKKSMSLALQNQFGQMCQSKTLESVIGIQLPKHSWLVHTSPCSLCKSSAWP